MPDIVPQAVISLLELREGFRGQCYFDTAKPPCLTAGMGHKLLPSELAQYKEGDTVPAALLEQWAEADTLHAYHAGQMQAEMLQCEDQRLIDALACVSFQLGSLWYKKLWGTWALLRKHEWALAAQHEELSEWARQTPLRAADFAVALMGLYNTEGT